VARPDEFATLLARLAKRSRAEIKRVPEGESSGEIVLARPNVMSGLLSQRGATQEVYPRWRCYGDLGGSTNDGACKLGRAQEVYVDSGGNTVTSTISKKFTDVPNTKGAGGRRAQGRRGEQVAACSGACVFTRREQAVLEDRLRAYFEKSERAGASN